MAFNIKSFGQDPNQRLIDQQKAQRQRITFLLSVCLVVLGTRLFVSNPPPPKIAVHDKKPLRAIPGMLDNIPLSARQKMDPLVLAKLQKADDDARKAAVKDSYVAAIGEYKPIEPLEINPEQAENDRLQQYQYIARKRALKQKRQEIFIDQSKMMLIRFQRGGFIKAEKVDPKPGLVDIRVDRTMVASLPSSMVRSVSENALNFTEPVPKGMSRLKPAKGITIVVSDEIAPRIRIKKDSLNEI